MSGFERDVIGRSKATDEIGEAVWAAHLANSDRIAEAAFDRELLSLL